MATATRVVQGRHEEPHAHHSWDGRVSCADGDPIPPILRRLKKEKREKRKKNETKKEWDRRISPAKELEETIYKNNDTITNEIPYKETIAK